MSTIHWKKLIEYVLISFLFFILLQNNLLVSSTALHIWRGQIVYFGGYKEFDLKEADEVCFNLGGKLPSVHSSKDIHELTQLIGQDAKIWLGAKPQDNTLPTIKPGIYQWQDSTPFDFKEWVTGYPNCVSDCCGVSVTTVNDHAMVDKDCKKRRKLICILPVLTNATVQTWLNDQFENFNETLYSDKFSIIKFQQQLSIAILNETMTSLQQSSKSLYSQLNMFKMTFEWLHRLFNESRMKNEYELKRILMNMEGSISQQRHQESKTNEKNQDDFESLSLRVNICFALLLIIILFQILVMTKTKLLSLIPVIPKLNHNKQFVNSRTNNLKSSIPTITVTPPNVRFNIEN